MPFLNSSLNISNSFIFLICEIHVPYTNPSVSFRIVMMLLFLLVFAPIEYLIAVNAESGVLFSQTEKPSSPLPPPPSDIAPPPPPPLPPDVILMKTKHPKHLHLFNPGQLPPPVPRVPGALQPPPPPPPPKKFS